MQRGVEVATGLTGRMDFLLAEGREVATSLAFDLLRPYDLSEWILPRSDTNMSTASILHSRHNCLKQTALAMVCK